MRIGFKVQLRTFEMFDISSNEYDTIEECLDDVYRALCKIDHQAIKAFRESSIFRDTRNDTVLRELDPATKSKLVAFLNRKSEEAEKTNGGTT